MDRRTFCKRTVAALCAVVATLPRKSAPPKRTTFDLGDRDPWTHYGHFANTRAARQHLLKPGERWLTPDDILQLGDSYLAVSNPTDWWRFDPAGGPGCRITACPVPLDCFCYTPKGSVDRIHA